MSGRLRPVVCVLCAVCCAVCFVLCAVCIEACGVCAVCLREREKETRECHASVRAVCCVRQVRRVMEGSRRLGMARVRAGAEEGGAHGSMHACRHCLLARPPRPTGSSSPAVRVAQARSDATEIEDVAVEAEITECTPQPDGWGWAAGAVGECTPQPKGWG
jgi:hypothetical protein